MRLLRHLIAGDVHRFRWLLVLWLSIEVVAATLDAVQPTLAATQRLFDVIGVVTSLLWVAEWLLMIVLIPIIIQADPLVGTDAFWMTRPVPPRRLLAAKALLLWIAIACVPIAIEAVVMAVFRVPAADILRVTAQNALLQTIWLVLLMGAASLTPTLARFVVLCGSVLIGLAVFGAVAALVQTALGGNESLALSVPGPSGLTGEVVLILLGIAAGAVMLLVQYATRSRMRSVAAGIAGLIVAFVVASVWPWPLLDVPPPAIPEWARQSSALRLSSDSGSVRPDLDVVAFRPRQMRKQVRARVEIDAMPADWSAQAVLADARLQLADGRRLTSASGTFATAALVVAGQKGFPAHEATRAVLGVDQLLEPTGPPDGASLVVLSLRDDEFGQLGQTVGRYEGRFRILLTHHEVEAVLPLTPGAVHQRGAYRIVVDGVLQRSLTAAVLAHDSDTWSMFDRQPTPTRAFYLRNPHMRQAVGGFPQQLNREMVISRMLPFAYGVGSSTGFTPRALAIQFRHFAPRDDRVLQIDNRWVAGAELVIVRTTQAGPVDRVLEIENFSVPAAVASISVR